MEKLRAAVDISHIDPNVLCKMVFLFNAVDDGWTVKKRHDTYLFMKKHENRKEVFTEGYLKTFLEENCSIK